MCYNIFMCYNKISILISGANNKNEKTLFVDNQYSFCPCRMY